MKAGAEHTLLTFQIFAGAVCMCHRVLAGTRFWLGGARECFDCCHLGHRLEAVEVELMSLQVSLDEGEWIF